MSKHDIDRFEDNARKIIGELMNLSRRQLESAGLPQPKGSASHLLQYAVMSFVGATNILIGIFRWATKKSNP